MNAGEQSHAPKPPIGADLLMYHPRRLGDAYRYLAGNMKRPIRVLALLLIGVTSLTTVFIVMTWPLFTSKETELTGLSFDLSEAAFFDDTGMRSEGHRIWIYRIPEDAAQRLNAADYPLSEYPMWSALAFDGYKRIRWMLSTDADSNELQIVMKSVLRSDSAGELTPDYVATLDDARKLASDLTTRDGTLVAGWYTIVDGDVITNYFVYIMNLDERILIKLSLLT